MADLVANLVADLVGNLVGNLAARYIPPAPTKLDTHPTARQAHWARNTSALRADQTVLSGLIGQIAAGWDMVEDT